MNIKYHAACGVLLDICFLTPGVMTLFSVLPDLPLIFNEYKLFKDKKKFDENEVSAKAISAYFVTHSLFFLPLVYSVSELGSAAYLLHIICDWFTHTGRFSAKPMYPFPYTVKFGRNILK